jgi:hypothetical protein
LPGQKKPVKTVQPLVKESNQALPPLPPGLPPAPAGALPPPQQQQQPPQQQPAKQAVKFTPGFTPPGTPPPEQFDYDKSTPRVTVVLPGKTEAINLRSPLPMIKDAASQQQPTPRLAGAAPPTKQPAPLQEAVGTPQAASAAPPPLPLGAPPPPMASVAPPLPAGRIPAPTAARRGPGQFTPGFTPPGSPPAFEFYSSTPKVEVAFAMPAVPQPLANTPGFVSPVPLIREQQRAPMAAPAGTR